MKLRSHSGNLQKPDATTAASKLSDEQIDDAIKLAAELREKADAYTQKKATEILERGNKIREKFDDVGAYAAAKGYDAIRTNSGLSGADTVILNRTKVIFREDQL